jgi:type IV secretory pathway VirB4 component
MVFSIRDLEDALRPIAMYVILNYIWNKIRFDVKKRMLVIDEAWIMMQYEDSAKFLYSIAKRARKYYLGLTTITQDIEDFLGSKYGKAVVANSSLQLLMRQSPASIDIVAETFNLTQGEKFLLLESEKGEGLFFAGTNHAAIKVVASYIEDQIVTTDPSQLAELRNLTGS